ncbi:hypothetical protein M0657_004903 [Pyricularia oryzae]|nr:hypothetical protein M9X92_004398 [Pyricularia oryzae]KAI7923893.1 hypothetical protein M0657_004903 [Pyricularia oryzae]
MWTKAAWAGPITLSWRNFAFNAWVTSACTVNASQFSGNNSRRLPDLPVRARGDLDRCRQDVKMSSTKIEAIDTLRQIVGLVLITLCDLPSANDFNRRWQARYGLEASSWTHREVHYVWKQLMLRSNADINTTSSKIGDPVERSRRAYQVAVENIRALIASSLPH